MPHGHAGNSIVGSGQGASVVEQNPFDYYLGSGFLPYQIDAENADTNFAGVQSQTGLGLLGALTQMLTNPTGGPLGLAAAARFGGPQSRATATDGQGIDTSKEQSVYDQLVESLSGFASGINAQPGDVAFNGEDSGGGGNATSIQGGVPHNAPPVIGPGMQIPTGGNTDWASYMGAPSIVNDRTDWSAYMDDIMGLMGGGRVPLKSYAEGGKVDLAKYSDEQLAKFGGRTLIKASREQGSPRDFGSQMQNIAALMPMLASGAINPRTAFPDQTIPFYGTQASRYNMPTLADLPPELIQMLMQQNAQSLPYPTLADPGPQWNALPSGLKDGGVVEMEDGGGMQIGGAPHFIVDADGNKVAALTEDGKPEEVKGVGGVEVIPLDPMRNALYESRKQQAEMANAIAQKEEELQPTQKVDPNKLPMMTPDTAAQTPNIMPKEIANLELGGFAMLPEQWRGGGDVGSVRLPTQGGPSGNRQTQIGDRTDFKADDGRTIEDMLSVMQPGLDESNQSQFAQMLGGFLSDNNEAIPLEALRSLNAGRAPEKLLSSTDMATLDTSTQAHYAALLQQMGIIDSPQQLIDQQRKFAPTALR